MGAYPIVAFGPRTPADVLRVGGDTWIRDGNGRYWDIAGLRRAIPRLDGVPVYLDHAKRYIRRDTNEVLTYTNTLGDDTVTNRVFESNARDCHYSEELIGHLCYPLWSARYLEMRAVLVVDDPAWVRRVKAVRHYPDGWGFSLSVGRGRYSQRGPTMYLHDLYRVDSLDLVEMPASGGRFLT